MTETHPPTFSSPPLQGEPLRPAASQQQGTTGMVKDQAAELSHSGVQAGKHTADVARAQASEVAAEASRQGRDLLRQAQDQFSEQAAQGQQRLASELLSFSDQLSSMADDSSQGGMSADLARQVASRVRDAGRWLDDRQPSQVVGEVQSFARRRPAIFLAMAAGAGLVAGRLTRGLKDASSDGQEPAAPGAPRGMPDSSGGPAVGLPVARGVPGRDASTDFGDSTVTGRGQASGQDRP